MTERTFYYLAQFADYVCRSCVVQHGNLEELRNNELGTMQLSKKCPVCKH